MRFRLRTPPRRQQNRQDKKISLTICIVVVSSTIIFTITAALHAVNVQQMSAASFVIPLAIADAYLAVACVVSGTVAGIRCRQFADGPTDQ